MSELALKLIEENKKTRDPFLDLGNCGLTKIPIELGKLFWLEELSLSNKPVKDNYGDWHMVRKVENKIKYLKGMSYSENPFYSLVNLKKIWFNCDPLKKSYSPKDISALRHLRNLEEIDFSNTHLTSLDGIENFLKLRKLDISSTRVSNISAIIGLSNLVELNIANTRISSVKGIQRLHLLNKLSISNTSVSNVSFLEELQNIEELSLASTRVKDIAPLSSFVCLKHLNISNTKISDVAPISKLTQLQRLLMSGCEIYDIVDLKNLVNLQILDLSRTKLSSLDDVSALQNLRILSVAFLAISDIQFLEYSNSLEEIDLSYTSISDLSPLTNHKKLRRIDLSYTKAEDLLPLQNFIKTGIKVTMYGNFDHITYRDGIILHPLAPLKNPPMEVVMKGNAAILNYFQQKQDQGVDNLYEAKLLIVGEGGAGKTSLLRRLYQTDKPLPEEAETTKGIEIHRHEFPSDKLNRNFRLNVWDFGGQEIYHATHQFFLTKRSLYVLLDDTRKDNKNVQDKEFKYWLEVVDQLSDHSPVLIFQNEKGDRSKTIDLAGIKGRFPNVVGCYQGNLEKLNAADMLRKAVELFASQLPHIGEELPARWVTIRADIEKLADEKPYITQQAYFELYTKHLEFDRTKALFLSQYFHDLGVFLHFQEDFLLQKTVILQNEWATEAVFKMLDDETVKKALGRFTLQDCQRVWQDSAYADMHSELLALMQKFELCYPLADTRPEAWLATQLLPPSKPESLIDWAQAGDLVLRFRYEFMPKGLISRLMVRLHRFVPRPDLGCITGVLFERDDTHVLVEVSADGREIVLRGRGPERKELLSVIAADLDAMNEAFHGLKDRVEKLVPCCCSKCKNLAIPESFEQKRLLQRKRDGKLKVECPGSYEDVQVLELLDGIQANYLPAWAKDEKPEANSVVEFKPSSLMKTVKIFLASSSELKQDRDEFELYFRQLNDSLKEQGIYLQIIRWENFFDAMSETRLQDEYNQAVRGCDIFVSLFFTKTGKYTEEEFNNAHEQFKVNGKPYIFTFFKNADVNMGSIDESVLTLLGFKKRLGELGHFFTGYDSVEHLKRQFREQLDKLLSTEKLGIR